MQNASSFQVYNASAGSGKTYTLVKSYLKIILSTSDRFRFTQILALTFTNKAAQEMKSRVLENLKAISEGHFNDMADDLCESIPISQVNLQQNATKVLNEILNNYSGFSITTIDSFTYKLIRNFAFDLGLSLNFEVELNTKNILNKAVELLLSKIGKDEYLTEVLLNFALYKWEVDKTWDVSFALNDIAQLLSDEDAILELESLKNKTLEDYKVLHKTLQKVITAFENDVVAIGEKGLQFLESNGLNHEYFSSKDYPNFLKKLKNKTFDTVKFEGRLANNLAKNTWCKKGTPSDIEDKILEHQDLLKQFFYDAENLFESRYSHYIINTLMIENLVPFSVLSEINNCVETYKKDNNIRLNSEFNQIIRTHIKNEPAPFIYEKIGEKFKYFFIDEMQDTSSFQWENLVPLIANALHQPDSSLFLVGDAKQAIYRWRGGKPSQFINLSLPENVAKNDVETQASNPFFINKTVDNLDTNFRSFSEVIDFNNQFFQFSADYLNNQTYRDLYKTGNSQEFTKKKGGYVQIDFVEKPSKDDSEIDTYSEKIIDILKNLDPNYNLGDVCVLVRKKKNAVVIAEALSASGYDIVTSDSLLLNQSASVLFCVDFFKYFTNTSDKKSLANALVFLHQHLNIQEALPNFLAAMTVLSKTALIKKLGNYNIDFIMSHFNGMSLYQAVSYFMRCFKMTDDPDAYLQFFLEEVLKFEQQKKGNLAQFLEYFESHQSDLSIVSPQNKNAIQILTIHKAKGLEFPVVIFPNNENIYFDQKPLTWYHPENPSDYNNFESLLISGGAKLEKADSQGQTIYNQTRETLELDNINLLYVGLTRAVEQLYVVTEQTNSSEKTLTFGNLFQAYLENNQLWEAQKTSYEFGIKKRPEMVRLEEQKSEESVIVLENTSTDWDSHHIQIVSQASKYWNEAQQEAANYGTLLHDILAQIKTEFDVDEVIQSFKITGKITAQEATDYADIIKILVQHPKLKIYYTNQFNIFNECEIITNAKQLYRLDRLMLQDDNAIIIDYKTGAPAETHQTQINQYADAIQSLNYIVTHKILVYLQNPINVVFVN